MMKTLRYAFARTLPIMAGYLVLGLGFGVLLQSKGYGVGWSLAMSTLIYAGSKQYVTIDLLAGGASLISVALMTLMVNARHLFYGIALLDRYQDTGRKKPYLIFGLSDETFSVTCSAQIPPKIDKGWFFFWVTALDQLYWVTGATLGGLFGSLISFNTEGLDFVMTAMFVVILLEQWLKEKNHTCTLLGLGLAALSLFLFGPDGFMLPAMGAILAVLLLLRSTLEKEGAAV